MKGMNPGELSGLAAKKTFLQKLQHCTKILYIKNKIKNLNKNEKTAFFNQTNKKE